MASSKITISLPNETIAKIEAIGKLENRGRSNTIKTLLNFTGYTFVGDVALNSGLGLAETGLMDDDFVQDQYTARYKDKYGNWYTGKLKKHG